MFGLNFLEIFALMMVGVVVFGKDLPTVAKSVGKMVMDLRSSFRNLGEGFLHPTSSHGSYGYSSAAPIEAPPRPPRVNPSVPKFVEDDRAVSA